MTYPAQGAQLLLSLLSIDTHKDWGGYNITNFGNLALINALTSDHSGSGIITENTVGEAVAIADLLYMKSDGKYHKADADAATTMPGVVMAMEAISANASGRLLHYGYYRDDSWSWTVGGLLYVSPTPGNPTQTRPTGSGQQVQVVGHAIASNIIFFKPISELVEIA